MDLLKTPLDAYLRHRFGPEAVAVSEARFPRGSSRLTYFVDVRQTPDSPVIGLVFRGDFEGGSVIDSPLDQEYFMYERLGHTDVPIARVLWWEEDPAWAQRPFYVREQIEGHWDVPHFKDPDPAYDPLRIAISKEHLGKLAMVHRVDWRGLGLDARLPPPPDAAGSALHFIDQLMARLADCQREPMPFLIEAVAALRRDPPVAASIGLCKGTNGLGEEVFRDGVIVAMSDWEEATIGDPAADFASMQDFIPEIVRDGVSLWGMEQAIAYYNAISGHGLRIENVRFYQRLRALGGIVYGEKAAVIVGDGKADIRHGWTGTEVLHVTKRMLAAATGLAAPVDPAWYVELNETVI